MSRAHVFILCSALGGQGSVAQVALRHGKMLSERFRVTVISDSLPLRQEAGIRYCKVSAARFNWLRRYCHVPNALAFLLAVRNELIRLCEEDSPDIVMCHSHALAALVGAGMKQRYGFRVVMTTHGDIFDRPAKTYSRELTWFYRWVTPLAYKRSDYVQALSPYMADWAIKGGASKNRVRVIPNGIELVEFGCQEFMPREESSFIPYGKLRLIYIGHLWNVKGVDVLIRALARLSVVDNKGARSRAVWKPDNFSLILVGDGPEKRQLMDLANELGLSNRVEFLGRVPRQELASHYRQADILCIPSLSEALPTVVLEAMYCGLPVVGSATGGIPFMIQDGVNGYLFKPGDAAELADAIARAAQSRDHLAALGGCGYVKSREQFTWGHIAVHLEELVQDALRLH